MSDLAIPHCCPPGASVHDSPGKITEAGCHSLLQGTFPTQVSCTADGFFTIWATRGAQEYWCGLPFPSTGDLPYPGLEPRSSALQGDSLPSDPPGDRIRFCCFKPLSEQSSVAAAVETDRLSRNPASDHVSRQRSGGLEGGCWQDLPVSQHSTQDPGRRSRTRGSRHGAEAGTEPQGQSADGRQWGAGTPPHPGIPHASWRPWAPLQALAGGPAPPHILPASARVSAGSAVPNPLQAGTSLETVLQQQWDKDEHWE